LSSSKDISKSSDQIYAVIPFYNEKDTLSRILNDALIYVDKIIAVNDGSDDCWSFVEKNDKIHFINLDQNSGKGKALRIGFQYAILNGADVVVTLDADLQHEAKYIPNLVDGLKIFDIVIGNRLKNLAVMPIQRRISNKLTSLLLSLKTGQKIIDSQCGFRAYKLKVIKNIETSFPGFEAESEMIVKAARKGYTIGFVNITTIYGTERSKMRPIQAIIGFLRVLFS
jgi:glycosyltransferase involved in cell wall biosynthesis